MGIESNAVQFLCAAKNYGVDFDDVLMVGRQIFFPDPAVLGRAFQALGVHDKDPVEFCKHRFAEPFFEVLGARRIRSVDVSDFEGAELIHDMNQPLPPEMRNVAGVVFDGGTIEHVFHVSQALKNLMEMVRVGGWFIQVSPANNFMGHGFWQLSPEVSFRAFTPENGFEPPIVFVKEWIYPDSWYAAREPAQIRRRVELTNSAWTAVCTIARKTADVEVFKNPPQQSDYETAWESSRDRGDSSKDEKEEAVVIPAAAKRKLPFHVPFRVQQMVKWGLIGLRATSPFNPEQYDFVPESELLKGRLKPTSAR